MGICMHFGLKLNLGNKMVGVQCSHHCTYPAPQEYPIMDPIKALKNL